MSLRKLARICLALVLAGLLMFGLLGFQAWRSFHLQLAQSDQLSDINAQLHDMTAAIDYITLVRSDAGVIQALSAHSRELAESVDGFDQSQARLTRAHLIEIADMVEHLLVATPNRGQHQAADSLLLLSRQIRVHHAAAQEAIHILIREANVAMLDRLYGGLRILSLATLALAVMILISVLTVHRRLLAPILALNTGLRRVRDGDLSARLDFERNDEFGQLARSFNLMAEQRQEFESELAESETRFRQLAENIGEVFWVLDPARNQLLYVSPAFEKLWGKSVDALFADPELWRKSIHPDDRENLRQALTERQSGEYQAEYRVLQPDGGHLWVFDKCSAVYDDRGQIIRLVGVARDITERKLSQLRLAERVKELRCLYRVLELTAASGNLSLQETMDGVVRLLPGSLRHDHLAVARIRIDEQTCSSANWRAPQRLVRSNITVDGNTVGSVEVGYVTDGNGEELALLAEEHALINGVAIHLGRMIKNRRLNETLTRSERLKAVGELTGGIAHDFNNLLTVIMGNAELLETELASRHLDQAGLARMISKAAHRGADLTARLLAFARRQSLEPSAIDLNDLLSGMDKLLRRTLGENIELHLVTSENLWPAMADVAQLESAILNLALNSRDAMPGGGRLTLETRNRALDATYAASQEELEAGDYVMLAISDTGHGMKPELLTQIFEPFFTTKQKGSGLGLSMVYGLVKQLHGHVRVYSELDQGTSVCIYLQRADRPVSRPISQEPDVTNLSGTETILLAEDNELVRGYARDLLKALGYKVIEAADGPHALVILRAREDIDLLFTDVIMPGGISGPELARLATELHPDLPVLFTSGYTENAALHHGRLDQGAQLLSKPYRRSELAQRVRQMLEHNP